MGLYTNTVILFFAYFDTEPPLICMRYILDNPLPLWGHKAKESNNLRFSDLEDIQFSAPKGLCRELQNPSGFEIS